MKLISQLLKDDNYAEALAVYTSGNFSSKGIWAARMRCGPQEPLILLQLAAAAPGR